MSGPPNPLLLLSFAAFIAAAGDELARRTSRRVGWAAAGGSLLIAAAPVVPNYTIVLGFSLDDTLPVLGLLLLVPLVPWHDLRRVAWSPRPGTRIAIAGLLIMVLAGVISAVLLSGGPGDVLRLALRGSGRLILLLLVVVCIAVLARRPEARRFNAIALAAVGAFEAAFGLIAYLVGLPEGAGLEPTRPSSALFGQVPGRISGTLGISPNFTAAVLMMTMLVTAGLALEANGWRHRLAWWSLVVVQLAALALTYTRVSLGLSIIALVVLVLMRSRPILLAPIAVVLGAVAVFTPTLQRLVSDVPDRLALWSSGFLLMIDHPLTGVGPGQTLSAVAQQPERYRATPFGQAWSTAHNTVLLAGAETGVLGAIGAIVLNLGLAIIVLTVLVRARQDRRASLPVAAALALGAFLAQGMVNNLMTVGVTGLVAAYLIGSLLVEGETPAEVPVTVDGRARTWSDLLAGRWRPSEERRIPPHQDLRRV